MAEVPIHKEIEQRFGVLPNFFRLASDTPEVTTNLWGFAKFAYLDSPLPSLFKERLFVYLSRFCEVRYCIARHIGFLVGLGYPAGDRDSLSQTVEQVLPLLQRSLPRGEELEPAIALCAAFDPDHFEFPSLDTPSESAIFACVTHVFLQTSDAPSAIAALRQGLGAARLEFFNVFLAFVRMAHYWTQIHPELRFEDDINHLLETHEALADCLLNDPEVKDNALSQQVLEELAELRQLRAEHESLVQKYEVVSRENEQLPIERQQRQRVEAALRESEDQFRNMADSSPVLLWQTDETGATFVNRYYLEFFAQTFDSIKGMGWANFLHPDDAAAYLEAYRTAFERQERYEFQCRLLRHDGEYRWLQSVGEPHYGLDHTFLGFVGCLFDVTDIKAAEAVLKESEEQFRNMADNAPMMLWVTDTTGYCTYLSRSWYDFTGQTEATGLGFGWLDATHPDDRESAQAIFLVANDRQEAFQLEYRLRHQDGYYRTCIDAAKPWFGVNGEFKGYIGSVIDIEDRKRVEEISQQAAELSIFRVTLTDALRSLVDPVEIQATASRVLGEHLGATRVAYFEVRGADYVVERDYVNGVDALAGRYSIDSFGSKLLSAYRTGCTVSSPNIAADPYLSPEQQSAYAAIQIGAYIGIPLIKKGEFVAGLAVHAAAPRSWTPEEVALTEEVADRTWAAVERARAEVALRESEARLTADLAGMQRLYHLYATLATGLDLKTALNEFLVVACEFTQTDRGCVQLVSDDGTRLEMFTWHGYSDDSPFINHFRYEGFKQGCDQARVARQRFVIEETIGYPGLEGTEAGAAAYAEGIRATQSTPIINRSGESIGVLSTQFSQPHRPTDDELKLVDLLAWTAADFVEQYRAHTALRESEKKYRSLFESINQGFCLLEVLFDANDRAIDYRYLEINDAFEQQSGLVDAVGKTILELVPNLEPQWAECYDQVVKSGEAVRFEADVPSMNRVFDIYAFPRGAPGQNLVAVLFNDITDRKTAELEREQLLQRSQAAREAAENANRIKDEFLAVVSHELRSPLNPILGWSKLLQQGKLDGTKTANALAIIERNAQLQAQLIDDLLDISRILRGKLSFDQLPVDLRKVIASALETVHLAAEAKSLHIETILPPNIGTVMGDAARLQQVVWNLLSNAVKFTPHNGRITIILTQGITHAQIQVTDNGKGINPEFLPYVFEHFRQEDGATTRKFGGLGLGLAIARQIVELHGGTVAVDSPGEGQGATLTVRLPLASVSSQTLSRAVESVSIDDDLSDIHILVVDDEPDSREFVAFVLEQAGASVINVTSGMEALQAIGQSVPDLIISDIGMPEMDGYMLMRQIRALQQGRQIPAIALTAYAGELDRQQARASGFQRHLVKPVSPTEIIAVVAHLCGQKGQISA